MSKHTPGPWQNDGFIFLVRTGDNKRLIAQVDAQGKCGTDEDEANANLIAAAPELLEALIEARDSIIHWSSYVDDYFKEKHNLEKEIASIDRVISKANGESK